MKTLTLKSLSCVALSIAVLSGCANMSETQKGTAQGAGIGAVAGALLGAAVGGGKGAATGAVLLSSTLPARKWLISLETGVQSQTTKRVW